MLCPVLTSLVVCKDSFSYSASEQGEAVAEVTGSVGVPRCHCCWNFHGCVRGAEGKGSSGKALPWVGEAQRQSLGSEGERWGCPISCALLSTGAAGEQ